MNYLPLLAALVGPAHADARTVEAVLQAARAAGLPTETLEAKAAEGAAKGVPPDRVAGYLEALRLDLARADALLGDRAADADRAALLAAAAAALRAGGSGPAILELAESTPTLRAPAVRGFADLIAAGCPEPGALALIHRAAQESDPSAALRARLETTFSLLAQGEPVATALDRGAAPDHAPPAWGAGGSKDKDQETGKDKEPPGKAKGHDKK